MPELTPLDEATIARIEAKLERQHAYFGERGITPATVAAFGLGYFPADAKGMMRNHVVAPLRGLDGAIYGYLGRWVGPDATIPKGEGKYKLPKLRKLELLYGLHEAICWRPGVRHLVVVEGTFSVYRLRELGVPAVALLGHELSVRHLELLEHSGMKRLTFLLDGDDAGRASVPSMMKLLASSPLRAKFAVLPEGTQPDTVEWPILGELLGLG